MVMVMVMVMVVVVDVKFKDSSASSSVNKKNKKGKHRKGGRGRGRLRSNSKNNSNGGGSGSGSGTFCGYDDASLYKSVAKDKRRDSIDHHELYRYTNPNYTGGTKQTVAAAAVVDTTSPSPSPSREKDFLSVDMTGVHKADLSLGVKDPMKALVWLYIDNDKQKFGPFDRSMMRDWFAAGMIQSELKVRPFSRDDRPFLSIKEIFQEKTPFFELH